MLTSSEYTNLFFVILLTFAVYGLYAFVRYFYGADENAIFIADAMFVGIVACAAIVHIGIASKSAKCKN